MTTPPTYYPSHRSSFFSSSPHLPTLFRLTPPPPQRPIIFSLLIGQNPGFTKNTTYETRPTKDYVRNYKQIMQNKPNFQKSQMNVNILSKRAYENFIPLAGQKNKPNSKPIKTNSNPKQSQFQCLSNPNKPNLETTPGQEMVKISFCIYGNRGVFWFCRNNAGDIALRARTYRPELSESSHRNPYY